MSEQKHELTSEEKRIIEIGKANERLNKYCIKICLAPVLLSVMLILTYTFTGQAVYCAVGIILLVATCLFSTIWFLSLVAKASKCGFTQNRYEHLLRWMNTSATTHPDKADNTEPAENTQSAENNIEPLTDESDQSDNTSECEENSECKYKYIYIDGTITPVNADDNIATANNNNDTEPVSNLQSDTPSPTTQEYIEKFSGNAEAALVYIGRTYEYDELDKYIDEWDSTQAKLFFKFIKREYRIGKALEDLNTTEEYVLNNPNPYLKSFLIILGIMCLCCFAMPFALKFLISDTDTAKDIYTTTSSIIIGVLSLSLASRLMKLIQFSNLKRRIKKSREINEIIENTEL